jgi:flagellar protein FliO/FliZ
VSEIVIRQETPGGIMDLLLYLKYLVVLVFVLGLIGLITVAVRKFGFVPVAEKSRNSKKRLAISQMIGLDAKRRLVLVRRDDKEHLLLLGPNGDVVVETNILAPIKKTTSPEEIETEIQTSPMESEPRLPTLKPHASANDAN